MSSARPRRGTQEGAVLVFVVLIMLALFGLAHGLLVSALADLSASRAAVRELESRWAAEAALQVTLNTVAGPWMDSVPVWGVRSTSAVTMGQAEGSGALRRLAPELWLAEGRGWLRGGAVSRSGWTAWSLDPLRRVTSLGGVASVGPGAPVAVAGPIDATGPTVVESPLAVTDCEPWLEALEAHYSADPLATVTTLTGGTPPALGLLDFTSLLTEVESKVLGSGTPGPVETIDGCNVTEPWNWGDPEHAWRPCGAHLPLRAADEDLVVDGGTGQGLLAVDGDLTLTAGARYYGLLMTRGALRLQSGAVFEGMALAGGGIDVAADARVQGSACWAVRALSAQRATLGRLIPLPGTGRIGPF